MKNEQYIKKKYNWQELQEIVHILRQPDGCPWDSAQTYESLKTCVINEANEVVEAVNNKDFINLKEELGDLLFLVVLYADLAKEQGDFTMEEVISCAAAKMIRRHPHVFDDGFSTYAQDYDSADMKKWNFIKLKEKEERLEEYKKLYEQGKIGLELYTLQEKKLQDYKMKIGIMNKK